MSPGGLPLLLGLGLAVAYGAVLLRTWWLLTRPPRRSLGWALGRGLAPDPGHLAVGPGGAGLRFGPLTVASRGRRLAVWDIVGLDPEGPVMLLTHGWGESRIASLPRVAALAPLASRLICWDLPGHGDSGGACALGLREADDLARVVQAAGSERRLVLVGSSLGAGVSIAAAARSVPAAAVIAEGPYRFAAAPA
ncbi:MAG TPA: alpha/beta hydrolase, partial [Phycisphaerales bacterium]|nr:alpha/beta hydrolase [Phycisphaerales bacterium]